MKKLLAILLALVMCMTLLPLAALAEGEETRTVYAKVPDGWEKVYLYAWVGDENTGWTGKEMTKSQTNQGWYEATISTNYVNAIVHNGSTQTDDLDLLSGTNYITVEYANGYCGGSVSDNAENGADSGYLTVYAKVPDGWDKDSVYFYAWDGVKGTNWPGVKMTSSTVHDGWFELQIPKQAKMCKVNNGNGAPQTQDLELANGNFITVDDNNHADQSKTFGGETTKPAPFEIKTVTAAGDGNQDDGYLNGKSWNPSAEENMLTNHDNIWTITYDNVKAGDHQLKFVLNENWEDNKCITGDTIPVGVKTDVACESSMRNMTFHVDADESTVKLELDLTDFDYENGTGAKLTITVTAPAVAPTPGEGNETDKPEGGDGNGETGDGGNSTTPGTGDETPTPTPGTGDETPTPTPGTGDGEGNGENGDGGSTTTPGTGNETNKPEDDKNNKNDKDEAKTITIYAKVPADWTEAYLYSWPDGGHGDPAWPGVKMTASKTHAGWYEAEIPENVQNVIVNAGSDKPQTVDLKLVSGSYFIVLGEAGADGKYSAKLNATADTATAPDNKDDKNDKDNTVTPDNKNDKDDTAAPAPDSKTITIYAQVPADWAEVYLYTWQDGANGDPAWPGTKMTASKTNAGWYELTIPADTQNVIVNAGNGNPQTVDLKLVSGSNYIVVGEAGEDGKYSAKMSSAPTGDSTELVAIAAALLMAATGMVATVAGKKKFF